MHRRSDYPFTNPLLQDKFLGIQRKNGRAVTSWREKIDNCVFGFAMRNL